MDENMLLNLAIDAGEIMLSSGAETHRVEDTMERILSANGKENMPEAFVTTTGLFASIRGPIAGSVTKFKRISNRSINLEKITRVNSLSRNFCQKKIGLKEAFEELENIHCIKSFSYPLVIFSYAISCSIFTLMFKGKFLDSVGAFFVGMLLGIFVNYLAKRNVSDFLVNILGGALIAASAIILCTIGLGVNYDSIIIGSLMPLVPGVATTNAIRDIMEGDFLSGTSRIVEAVLVAILIASGVGFVLKIYGLILGGL